MTCAVALCFLVSGWLTTHGYDPPHREAVLIYIRRESNFRPNAVARSGACLCQWAGVRRRAVLARGHGRCPSWEAQMAFADVELRSGLYGAFWRAEGPNAFTVLHRTFGQGRR